MTLDISEYTPMLKEYYTPRNVELITFDKFPTLRLLKKRTDWTGDKYNMPIWHEASQAVGHDFTTALANKSNGLYEKWELERSKIYGFASIDRLAMKASMGDARSFMRAYTAEVDGVLQLLGRELAHKIFRTRACVRSTVDVSGSTLASGIVALANREDHVFFSVGMRLVFSDAGGAPGATLHTPGSAVDNFIVSSIDRTNGTITVSDSVGGSGLDLTSTSGPANISAALDDGDFIHREGDVTAASATLGVAGFEEWVLDDADRGSPGTLFGVDRSVDVDKLGGLQLDASGYTVEDALIEAAMRAYEHGADLTHFCMNPKRLGYLIREVGSKIERDPEDTQRLGTSVFIVRTPAGEQRVYGDPNCQPNKVWGLNEEVWEMVSTGPVPEIFDEDLSKLRESDADAYEVRMGGYFQLGCHVPGENIVIEF